MRQIDMTPVSCPALWTVSFPQQDSGKGRGDCHTLRNRILERTSLFIKLRILNEAKHVLKFLGFL